MENKRIYCRLQNVKSNYSKIRADKANKSANKLNDSKGELFNLLVNQLGVKPSVLFPKVAKKKSIDHHIHKRKNSTTLSYPEKTLNVNLSTLENSFKVAKINQTYNPKVDRNWCFYRLFLWYKMIVKIMNLSWWAKRSDSFFKMFVHFLSW